MTVQSSAVLAPKSLRSFIGAKDYEESRSFYKDLGFEEIVTSDTMSYFRVEGMGFYLQRYFVEDWVNNTMLFWEVEDIDAAYRHVSSLQLSVKYPSVQLKPIQNADWGREFFLHDPAGVLWHIGSFID